MIALRLRPGSDVPAYVQIAKQVRRSLRLGLLAPGDQLPTVKEAVASLAVNPNTVLRAYQLLEQEGLVEGRQGLGTFVLRALPGPTPLLQATLSRRLDKWVRSAFDAGLDADGIADLFESSLWSIEEEKTA